MDTKETTLSKSNSKQAAEQTVQPASIMDDDDAALRALGYVPSFKREFSNLSTISFAFSIMGMCSSISTTFDTPYVTGGPAAVVWCWILGAVMCFTLGCSIAEIISAYPTSGGLYMASASLCPKRYRAPVGWVVAWLNLLGYVAGVSSTEYGLSTMIWSTVTISRNGAFTASQYQIVVLMIGLLIIHGILNCLPTKHLAFITRYFVFVNVGTTLLIIIVLLATTPRSEMNPPGFVFGSAGIRNGTSGDGVSGWPTGLAFLFGLLSVQWTMTDYDATAHISEEVKRAAYAAPAAIVIAVIGTGLVGWLFNIVIILCSGPITPELLSGSAVIQIMVMRMGKTGAFILWAGVCATAFFVVQTAQQATSRTIFAISRDHGLPDRGFFGHITKKTQTPLRAVLLATVLCILPGFLALASKYAAFAIFAMTTVALDLSYVIPIACRRIFANHPEVMFKPGPFYMGDGFLGWFANINCILWTLFICVILSLPTVLPTNAQFFNYAAPITGAVLLLSGTWYILAAHKHYKGPMSRPHDPASEKVSNATDIKNDSEEIHPVEP
ncbi:amino acid transporter [Serendipita vermifera]|nr:amino acid transporter [Serendipita vermifera]